MAPKHDRTAFIFAMAATILAIMTWAAFPHESDLAAPVPPKHFTGLTGGSPHCLRTVSVDFGKRGSWCSVNNSTRASPRAGKKLAPFFHSRRRRARTPLVQQKTKAECQNDEQ